MQQEIKSLEKTDIGAIYKAFNQAFADYEIQITEEQFNVMIKRRGFNPELSFAAFIGNEIVSFTLNGTGIFNGILTAYDTGTGTIKEYSGKGLATKVFEYSIPYLRDANIKQYLLEVLQHNTRAVSVYKNLGFEVTREFYYFFQKNDEINIDVKNIDNHYSIQSFDIEKHNIISDFWDFYPSWQNSFEAIQRTKEDFICIGAFDNQKLLGYSIFEPTSGDITQIAVDKQYRRKGVASLLFQEIVKLNKNDTKKIVNTDVLSASIIDFLKTKNIFISGKQFEMIKKL